MPKKNLEAQLSQRALETISDVTEAVKLLDKGGYKTHSLAVQRMLKAMCVYLGYKDIIDVV